MTKDQIDTLDLPRKPIEESTAQGTGGVAYNRRITEWEEAHGAGATELNAFEQHPEEFRRIVRDAFERLRGMMDGESALGEWQQLVQDEIGETEFPIAPVPDGEAALPEDPIYGSSRRYVENKARVDRYRQQ